MASKRLIPPKDGATVRFYRTGHGDCFLIAFAGESASKPAYVLIDCGYKPGSGSKQYLKPEATPKDIAKSIIEATGGRVDVAVITHEHQDHVNGITATNFKDLKIGELWLAWTEDPTDEEANKLREDFKDKLYGLLAARHQLAGLHADSQVRRIDQLLAFELGGDQEGFAPPPAAALLGAMGFGDNKKSMKVFKDLANKENGVKFFRPHEEIFSVPGAKDVRVYALGPPRVPASLRDMDPQGDEEFHLAMGLRSAGSYFAAAASGSAGHGQSPFATKFAIASDKAMEDAEFGTFFAKHYGAKGSPGSSKRHNEVPDDAPGRRIDKEWLYSAEQLALDVNDFTNNTSLVLAFELGKGGKVLLFAADAQRGNWHSWTEGDWQDGDKTVTVKDLLARTVLYKVGHHGSHNATLNGKLTDDWANLSWMATKSSQAREFTAMITAVRAWAETQDGWDHPLKAIKDALMKKASGRVFQTDRDFADMKLPEGASETDWSRFQSRASGERLFFDYQIKA